MEAFTAEFMAAAQKVFEMIDKDGSGSLAIDAGATLVDGPAYGRVTVNATAARVDVVGVETGDVLYSRALQ